MRLWRAAVMLAGLGHLALMSAPVFAQFTPPRPVQADNGFRLDRPAQQGGTALGWAPAGTTELLLDGRPIRFAADGRFIVGFGRDSGPTARLSARLKDGSERQQIITISKRAWQIETLPTLPRVAQPSAEFQARRPVELAQIEAARKTSSNSQGWRQAFIWPALGRISGVFGSQRIYAGEPGTPHNGVDVAGGAGSAVYAPADGVVILAAESPFTLEGNLLMLDHGMGLNSAFLHLSRIDVRAGDVVRQGQLIGAIGMTGRATGPHLHWGMRWAEERIDAALFVGPMPPVTPSPSVTPSPPVTPSPSGRATQPRP